MSSDSTKPDPRLEVLAYLSAHPSAADTLEGIVQWWLPIQRYETAKDTIQRALDDLVEQGIVDYMETRDGRRIFRLANFPADKSN
jgi:Fe2+ or Zn2+ uptake regulation protein